MGHHTWTDPNGYIWSAEINESVSPPQLDAMTAFMVTAPGESQGNAGELAAAAVATDANDPGSALMVAYNQVGKQFYPLTAEEQQLCDALEAVMWKFDDFRRTAGTVAADAQAVATAVKVASGIAVLCVFIPVVGPAIASIGGSIGAVDAAKVQPAIDELVKIVHSASDISLGAEGMSDDVRAHKMSLDDAKKKLEEYGQAALTDFWQVLKDCITALP